MYHVQMDVMKSGAAILMSGRTVIIDTGSTNLMVPENVGLLFTGPWLTLPAPSRCIQDTYHGPKGTHSRWVVHDTVYQGQWCV